MSLKTKVIVVHNIIAPYRVPLFNRIALQKDIDCEVIFCAETEKDHRWSIPDDMHFKYRVIPGFHLLRRNGAIYINPQLLGYLIRSNPDVVVTGEFSVPSVIVMLYCRLYNKKYVLWSDATARSESRVGPLKRGVRKQLLGMSSACIASGTEACEYLMSLGADSGKVKQSILTLDVERFSRECEAFVGRKRQLKKHLGLAERVVLYSGRLVAQKGLIHLIEAYSIVRRWKEKISLLLLGNGRLELQLRTYCFSNKLDVIFAGFVQQRELPKYYALADVFVFPSLCDSWGVVVNEALAAGLPIVCSKYAGAAADLVEDGQNGYVVDPRNIEILAEKIRNILDDNRRRFKMGRKSKEMMKLCTIERASSGFMSAITYVLSSTN